MRLILSKLPIYSGSLGMTFLSTVFFCLAFSAYGQSQPEQKESSDLVVIVLDPSQLPVPGASIEIKLGDQLVFEVQTDETGPGIRLQRRLRHRRRDRL
jgi:hypothetical protein